MPPMQMHRGGSRRAAGILVCLLLTTASACRSKSDPGAAGSASAAEGIETAALPSAKAAPPAEADGVALTGTPQALTFTGAVSGTIKDAAGAEGSLSGCTKSGRTFTARLAGMIAGTKDAYAVDFSVLSYEKPGAYKVPNGMNLNAGASVMIAAFDKSKLPMGLTAASGTVTMNPDEKGGEVDVDLKGGFGSPERSHLKGTWTCPPPSH
jgi:hypothetical protein